MATFGDQYFGHYREVAFIERSFYTQFFYLGGTWLLGHYKEVGLSSEGAIERFHFTCIYRNIHNWYSNPTRTCVKLTSVLTRPERPFS